MYDFSKIKEVKDVTPKIICDEIFGDFKKFKERFHEIKQGTLPVYSHAHPLSISKVDKMDDWPESYGKLRHLESVCFVCTNRGLFGDCKLSLKAVVGECRGLFEEATWEDSNIKAKVRENEKGGK